LGKLYLKPQPRYSEDIDLVQVKAEPIKETIDHLRAALAWLGEPVVKQKKLSVGPGPSDRLLLAVGANDFVDV
jgi:hypothetical protein